MSPITPRENDDEFHGPDIDILKNMVLRISVTPT
jgi:hypothetical protein